MATLGSSLVAVQGACTALACGSHIMLNQGAWLAQSVQVSCETSRYLFIIEIFLYHVPVHDSKIRYNCVCRPMCIPGLRPVLGITTHHCRVLVCCER